MYTIFVAQRPFAHRRVTVNGPVNIIKKKTESVFLLCSTEYMLVSHSFSSQCGCRQEGKILNSEFWILILPQDEEEKEKFRGISFQRKSKLFIDTQKSQKLLSTWLLNPLQRHLRVGDKKKTSKDNRIEWLARRKENKYWNISEQWKIDKELSSRR